MSNFIPNSFQVSNSLVDELMADMTGVELKCYLFVVRKTKGWNKDRDAISLSQFIKFTGAGKTAVIDALRKLVELGLLTKKTGSRNTSVFSINMFEKRTSSESELVQKVNLTGSESEQVTSSESEHIKNNIKNNINNTPFIPQGENLPKGKSEEKKSNRSGKKIDFEKIAELWNIENENTGSQLPFVEKVNDERRRAIKKFLAELREPTLECVEKYFKAFFVALKPHHFGENDRGWRANFDFAIKPKQVLRVREGAL